jgi:hypothetical protein
MKRISVLVFFVALLAGLFLRAPQCEDRAEEARTPLADVAAPVGLSVPSGSSGSFGSLSVVAAAALPELVGDGVPGLSFDPDEFTVIPFDGFPVVFKRSASRIDAGWNGVARRVWVGTTTRPAGTNVVVVSSERSFDAAVVIPVIGEVIYHRSSGGVFTVSASNSVNAGCGIDSVSSRPQTPPTAADLLGVFAGLGGASVLPSANLDGVPLVDLLLVYDSTALAAFASKDADPLTYMDAQFQLAVEFSNLFLRQSGVTTFQYRYLGMLPLPSTYTRSGRLGDDLTAMNPRGALASWLATQKSDYGADIVGMLVAHSADYGGIANMTLQAIQQGPMANFICACGGGGWGPMVDAVPVVSFAHEIAHLMGCAHDRRTAGIPADGLYCYGWLKRLPSNVTLSSGVVHSAEIGTIMSYATGGRVPYFSDPTLSVRMSQELMNPQSNPGPLGSGGNPDYGVQLLGDSAANMVTNNAKVLRDNGPKFSAVMAAGGAPLLSTEPAGMTTIVGGDIILSVSAGGDMAYQWSKDGVPVSGATSATLSLKGVTANDGGIYTVTVTGRTSSRTSRPAAVQVFEAGSTLSNLSMRAFCDFGSNAVIGGFVIRGTQSKQVLIRAVGPSLVGFGLPSDSVLSDPLLELHDASHGNVIVASNDNWTKASNASAIAETTARVGGFPLRPDDTKSAAMVVTLAPGAYSFVVTPVAGTAAGVVIIEAYDADPAGTVGSRLINLAGRSRSVPFGGNNAIGGFVVSGDRPKQVLLRAVGRSLAGQGISWSSVSADPSIELHSSVGGDRVISSNNNWFTPVLAPAVTAAAARVGAFPLQADDYSSAVLLVTLPPGAYTFVTRDAYSQGGVLLVEVYDAN